jgi:hypothetical protein
MNSLVLSTVDLFHRLWILIACMPRTQGILLSEKAYLCNVPQFWAIWCEKHLIAEVLTQAPPARWLTNPS